MKNIQAPLALAVGCLLLPCCTEDLDFDRISGDITAKPALMIPVANADMTVAELFPEGEQNVRYRTDEDGDRRLEIHSSCDSVLSYSIYDLLGIDGLTGRSFGTRMDLSPAQTLLDADPTGQASLSLSYTLALPVDLGDFELTSIETNYTITASYSGFGRPMTIDFGTADEPLPITLSGSGSKRVAVEGKSIAMADGSAQLTVAIDIPGGYQGSLGTVYIEVGFESVESITGSLPDYTFRTDTYRNITDLKSFKRFSSIIRFDDPSFTVTATNDSPLELVMQTHVENVGDHATLDRQTIEMPGATDDGPGLCSFTLSKRNSNIISFFHMVPEEVDYYADVNLRMPQGAGQITLSRTDSIYLGYNYCIPVEFSLDGTVDPDTMDLSDLENIEDVQRVKIYLSTQNSLPAGATVRLGLYDEDTGRTLTTVSVDNIFAMPEIDAKGKAHTMVDGEAVIELDEQQIAALRKSEALVVSVDLYTPDGKVVVLITENRFRLSLAFAAEVKLE